MEVVWYSRLGISGPHAEYQNGWYEEKSLKTSHGTSQYFL